MSRARDQTNLEIGFAVACVSLAVAGFYALYFGSLDGFVRAIDHCELVFCDFELHFYPVGRGIFAEGRPVTYFVYPPFAAFLFGFFGSFDYPTARALWAICQIGLAMALFGLARPSPGRDGLALTLAYLLVFATSVPLLHNAKWGQVSLAVSVAVLGCFQLHRRGQVVAAALLLAAAVAVKGYPALFLLGFALRRDVRFLTAFGAGVVAFLGVAPLLVLGWDGTLAFHRQISAWIAELTPEFLGGWNTQYAPAALSRVLWRKFEPESPAGIAFAAASYGLALLSLLGICGLERRAPESGTDRIAAMLFLLLPLLLPVAWPHYMVYLPFCQLVLARRARSAGGVRGLAAGAGVALSVCLASVFALAASGHWILYARRGMLAWADLALLAGFWVDAAPALRRARGAEGA